MQYHQNKTKQTPQKQKNTQEIPKDFKKNNLTIRCTSALFCLCLFQRLEMHRIPDTNSKSQFYFFFERASDQVRCGGVGIYSPGVV
jgi:hypothetical protein